MKSPQTPPFAALNGQKYLSLESYRKNGDGVRTPVWFAADGDVLYVYTTAASGKAKRIRRNPAVKLAPCDARGKTGGPWIDANATIEASPTHGMKLLNRKYWPWKQMLDLAIRLNPKHQRIVLKLTPATQSAPTASQTTQQSTPAPSPT